MSAEEELMSIQEDLDKAYTEYARRDFDLKYSHHQAIEDKLAARDRIVSESPDRFSDYCEKVFLNYDTAGEFLPLNANDKPEASWIKSFVARYEKDYNVYIEIHLNENPYLKNDMIFKRLNLDTNKSEKSELEWKERVDAPIFEYFENDDEDTMIFDILYEIYVDSAFYYFAEEETD